MLCLPVNFKVWTEKSHLVLHVINFSKNLSSLMVSFILLCVYFLLLGNKLIAFYQGICAVICVVVDCPDVGLHQAFNIVLKDIVCYIVTAGPVESSVGMVGQHNGCGSVTMVTQCLIFSQLVLQCTKHILK